MTPNRAPPPWSRTTEPGEEVPAPHAIVAVKSAIVLDGSRSPNRAELTAVAAAARVRRPGLDGGGADAERVGEPAGGAAGVAAFEHEILQLPVVDAGVLVGAGAYLEQQSQVAQLELAQGASWFPARPRHPRRR